MIDSTENSQTVANLQTYQKYRFMVAQLRNYLLTHILFLSLMILYYAVTLNQHGPWGLQVLSIILHILTTIFMLVIGFSDPGMVPNIKLNLQKNEYKIIPFAYNNQAAIMSLNYKQESYVMPIKTHNIKIKFCNSCITYRPPSTSHCDQCGICIQRFDHHCPWLGICIGKFNYRYFLAFLLCLVSISILIQIQIIIRMANLGENLDRNSQLAKFWVNALLALLVLLGLIFAFVLFAMHCYFLTQGITTSQFCKQTWNTISGNPTKKQKLYSSVLQILAPKYNSKTDLELQFQSRNLGNIDLTDDNIKNGDNQINENVNKNQEINKYIKCDENTNNNDLENANYEVQSNSILKEKQDKQQQNPPPPDIISSASSKKKKDVVPKF